jgi:hypothetical protein
MTVSREGFGQQIESNGIARDFDWPRGDLA